jgi:hypothetical protein
LEGLTGRQYFGGRFSCQYSAWIIDSQDGMMSFAKIWGRGLENEKFTAENFFLKGH